MMNENEWPPVLVLCMSMVSKHITLFMIFGSYASLMDLLQEIHFVISKYDFVSILQRFFHMCVDTNPISPHK